jgi:hypothetical protein
MNIHFLIFVCLAVGRCNPHLMENLDPSILPQHLLPIFGDAMLNEFGKSDKMILVMIQLRKLIFIRFLGGRRSDRIRIPRYKMRQFLTRRCDQKLSLPLSNLHFHLDYEAKIREAISQANRSSLFLTEGNYFVRGSTCEPMFQLRDVIVLHIFHPNGKFDAILTETGEIFMGRIGDPLELRVKVISSPFNDKRKAVACVFDPKSEMLVVGLMNGDFQFYKFTARSQGATPLFEMELFKSYLNTTGFDRRIVSITASPCGKYFVLLHDFSCGILVTKNGDNSFVVRQFLSDHDFMHIGTISALAFFSSLMILTVQSKKYCVWQIEIDGTITKVSEIEPINLDGRDPVRVKQIIVKDDADADAVSFIFRIKESILVLRIEDRFKTCRVLINHPIYHQQFAGGFDSEFIGLTIFLKGNLLTLVVPCQKTILLFMVKETGMTILSEKNIKKPTYWSFNPHTSVLTLHYDYGRRYISIHSIEPSVRIAI